MHNSGLDLELTRMRTAMLAGFSLATVFLIALHWHLAGSILWGATLVLIWRDSRGEVRRRMTVLMGCLVILTICDINTSLSNRNFLQVGIPFALVILLPPLVLQRTDPGVIRYRFWPRKRWRHDLFYTALSIPLAWGLLEFYWWVNPELYLQWKLPEEPDPEVIRRLFIGINLVGIWDELFFVNTVFAILRSLFRFPLANAVQAVVYTSVLYDMAFVGIGPVIIYYFALTQGNMFEKSENLLFVLIVHLIVDFFLVAAIVSSYYPSYGYDYLWRHGM